MQKFYSNAKVLLTGEYLVLDGVRSLALPCKSGQTMEVNPIEQPIIKWSSFDSDASLWMQESIEVCDILNNTPKNAQSGFYTALFEVLQVAHTLNKDVLNSQSGFEVKCFLSFPRLWGLGTSSTWINNVALWFKVNPYLLLEKSFKGSGYDIACANAQGPVFFIRKGHHPVIESVSLASSLTKDLYFVYLNQKQCSKEGIAHYREVLKENKFLFESSAKEVEHIGQTISKCKEVEEFISLIATHEKIISQLTNQSCVQETLFSDFSGQIKSLGAWGGDFVLVASKNDPSSYFIEKGYTTVIPYQDFILE